MKTSCYFDMGNQRLWSKSIHSLKIWVWQSLAENLMLVIVAPGKNSYLWQFLWKDSLTSILPMRTSLFWHSWPGPISVPSFFACSNLSIPPPNHLLQLSQGKLLTKLGGRWKLRLDISTIIPLDHPAVISLKYDNLLKKRILKCKSGQINDIWHVKWRVWKSERRCSLKFSGRWYL